jgi:hypothetical protein
MNDESSCELGSPTMFSANDMIDSKNRAKCHVKRDPVTSALSLDNGWRACALHPHNGAP